MSRDFRELGGRDAYALLGLDDDADGLEIKRAWRAMSRRHHADVGGSDTMQSLLNVAYDTLSDPSTRLEYDRFRRTVLIHTPTEPAWEEPWPDAEPEPEPEPEPRFEAEPEQPRHEAPAGWASAGAAPRPRQDDFIRSARPVGYDNLAVVSLVLALVCTPAALVTAPIALRRIRRTGAQGRGLAITALVLVAVLVTALTSGYLMGSRDLLHLR